MSSLDLRSFVARAAALVDASSPASLQETRTWFVDPFLETLGWTVRGESCLADRVVDDVRLEYVPTVESVPALFVAVEPATESLAEARANALRRAMAWTGVDRAIYTNGREYLLLAGTTDVDYRALELADLAANESAVADFSRATVGQRLGGHERTHVARRLAVERPALVASITDRLVDATGQGDEYADELEAATDRFLDRLVVAFAEDGAAPVDDAADVSIQFSESAIGDDGMSSTQRTDTDADAATTESADSPAASDPATDTAVPADDGSAAADHPDDAATAVDAETAETDARSDDSGGENDGDGEYVVRFFNDRGSIGAVGHSTSAGALAAAADYLLERGLAGVDLPWRPDDAERTVLNADPTHADGSPMAQPRQLSNGCYLATAGTVEDRAARVEALAARAGLRAMLTGDWSN